MDILEENETSPALLFRQILVYNLVSSCFVGESLSSQVDQKALATVYSEEREFISLQFFLAVCLNNSRYCAMARNSLGVISSRFKGAAIKWP